MSVWGKIGGTGIGLTVGGPLGAMLGALVGHYLVDRPGAPLGAPPPDVVLTTGLIALTAKMARADGVVLRSEIDAFAKVVIVPPAERPKVDRLFALAQQTTDGFDAYAHQVARVFRNAPSLLDDVLDGLFLVAQADGAVHEAEIVFLRRVAIIFGRTESEFDTILARHAVLPDDPYRVLGIDRSAAWPEIRAHYRRLVANLHPDREIARGLPPEAIKIATDRLAALNAAFDQIERLRRPKPTQDSPV